MIQATADTEYEVHELQLEDEEGRPYIGRLTAKELAEGVYLTETGGFYGYSENSMRLDTLGNLDDDELRNLLEKTTYIEVVHALGRTPVVDLDL